MEEKLEFDFSEYYKRVVEWNIKAGKLPASISAEDIKNQRALVDEEVNEYLDEIRKEQSEQDNKAILKELIDVFVVATYKDYLESMYGNDDEDIPLDSLAEYMTKSYTIYEMDKCVYSYNYMSMRLFDERNALVDLLACIHFQTSNVDLEGAMKAVLDNNDLKIYSCLETAQRVMDNNYNLRDYHIDSTVYLGDTYYTIKRKSDNKVMKNPNHKKCDLSEFIVDVQEDKDGD